MKTDISRRDFIKTLGMAGLATAGMTSCKGKNDNASVTKSEADGEVPADKMEMRTCPTTGDKVSLLGYGMMRLPHRPKPGADNEDEEEIDQEEVNRLVDYAIAHGVNYFDTSPAYCRGFSERSTGIALKRYPREKVYIATKLSNFNPATWSREGAMEIYRNSFKELQVDYIDYMLLHAVGGGQDCMEELNNRYMNNGMLDFLVDERRAGRIRNLGFSFHGDVKVFDYLLQQHDKYHWDFVQIQLNYVDWEHATATNPGNIDAVYLYGELQKRGIPAIVMEPLLGGRLARVPDFIVARLKQRDPERSVASWAFRFAGTFPGVLTVLSGMTLMEHLQDNLRSYCPLVPLNDDDMTFLKDIANHIAGLNSIPCNECDYCMPCPYGINIPAIFHHYNKCLNEGNIPNDVQDENYRRARRAYLVSYDRAIPKVRQADHCIGCGQCVSHCPQRIKIPRELHKISDFVDKLKTESTIL
ncbi:MAG: aldo/keto reductase [Prevotella sp.]